ncbi:hypothetical protein [Micromonospora sp. NPDC023814]|uniref:hypothetical protein n=1 Tax=Micromonospora sp. NPDC023814 TaxID=3154596 RepID=UPI0033FB9772
MKTRRQRAAALNVRGNVALVAAVAFGCYLGVNYAGAGGWTALHTWLAAALATAALTALTCYALAWRFGSPRGESPRVSHPTGTPSLTPHEVRK